MSTASETPRQYPALCCCCCCCCCCDVVLGGLASEDTPFDDDDAPRLPAPELRDVPTMAIAGIVHDAHSRADSAVGPVLSTPASAAPSASRAATLDAAVSAPASSAPATAACWCANETAHMDATACLIDVTPLFSVERSRRTPAIARDDCRNVRWLLWTSDCRRWMPMRRASATSFRSVGNCLCVPMRSATWSSALKSASRNGSSTRADCAALAI
mmetsp:Transcript_526/g.1927  ORF Transcript_526/g.1927 Transcript_526/m.1927 type:complete len:215 (-) Transcript_526:34-678(-)